MVTAGAGKNAHVWEVESGKLLYALQHPARDADVNHVNFSLDGKIITTAGDENVCLWDAATGKLLGKPLPHAGAAYQAIFSPDGSLLLTAGHDNKAYL